MVSEKFNSPDTVSVSAGSFMSHGLSTICDPVKQGLTSVVRVGRTLPVLLSAHLLGRLKQEGGGHEVTQDHVPDPVSEPKAITKGRGPMLPGFNL